MFGGRIRAERWDRGLRTLGIIASAGMLLVLLMGMLVTDTNSGRGCGGTWPLCHGQLIPTMAVHTLVEFSHRAVAGIEAVLIGVFAVWAWVRARGAPDIRVMAVLAAAGVFAQAGLGAADVLFPESAAVLALHFGVSLIAFASVVLLTVLVWTFGRPEARPLLRRQTGAPAGLGWWIWLALLYVYGLVYLGAYVAHVNAGLACEGWPLCSGMWVPKLTGSMGVSFAHRLAALGGLILLALIAYWARRVRAERPDLYRMAHLALGLIVLQALSGALLVDTKLSMGSVILHGTLVALLFAALSVMALAAVPARARAPAARRAPRTRRKAGG